MRGDLARAGYVAEVGAEAKTVNRKQKTALLERDVEAGSQILVGQSVKSELVFVRLFQKYLVDEPCSLMFF